ncbi:MAG TPA: 2Fe-2S iron-sulfur cluster-binding protein [Terriglobales bacterium]|nr:2Fe-2S iron-sulfur cluster-binding protein [Terriglobales bacterium]
MLWRVELVLPEMRAVLAVGEDQFVWQAAGRAGIALPSRCRIGWCLTCAARLLAPGEGEVDQSAARRYFAEDRAAGFILPCTARPRSDLIVLTHQAEAMRQHRLALGLPASLG